MRDTVAICFNNICTKEGLKRCTSCKLAWYCSKECQEDHWKRHKKCCKMISSIPEMSLRYFKAVNGFNICNNNRERGEFDQALLSLQESLEIFKEFQDDSFISISYFEIGYVLVMKKTIQRGVSEFLQDFGNLSRNSWGKPRSNLWLLRGYRKCSG